MRKIKDFVEHMNQEIPAVASHFHFERHVRVVGRSATEDSVNESYVDADIHDGTIISSHGYARLARHKPTGTICLIASKASLNLQGVMQSDNTINATRDGLDKSYIVAAYRTSGKDEDIYKVVQKLRRAHRRFGEDLGERSEKHFTLYGMSFPDKRGGQKSEKKWSFKKAAKAENQVTAAAQATGDNETQLEPEKSPSEDVEVYTNGRIAYEMRFDGKKYKIRFIAPTRRKDGSFVPIHEKQDGLSRCFASVSRTIAKSESYEQARHDMMLHWQNLSSKLWDEKSIFADEGGLFKAKKFVSDVGNHIVDKGAQTAFVTLMVGLITGLINPKYGIVSGIIAAVIHTSMDLLVDEGYVASAQALKKSREAKNKLNIDAYRYGEDVADHFKIQTPDNIDRLCAKMDLERFNAGDFELLKSDQSQMLQDHEVKFDGFRPSSLRAHLLFVHQRGFSSHCIMPDSKTRVDAMQSGLVRVMHEKPDGKTVIYARYRADVCTNECVRLPEDKRLRMGDKIWRFEYDRTRNEFHHAFKRGKSNITIDDMMTDLKDNLLFKDQDDTDSKMDDAQKQSVLDSVRGIFTVSGPNDQVRPNMFMSGMPARPPRALNLV